MFESFKRFFARRNNPRIGDTKTNPLETQLKQELRNIRGTYVPPTNALPPPPPKSEWKKTSTTNRV